MTGGRGIYEMSFMGYEQVPQHLQADVIAQHKQEEEAES